MQLQRLLLRAMLWMLGLAAAAGVLTVFMSTRVMGRVAGTALIAAVAIGAAMPLSRMLDDEKRRTGGVLSLGGVVAGFISGLCAVWIGLVVSTFDMELKLALTSLICSIGGVLAGVLFVKCDVPWARWSARVALCVDAVSAATFLLATWTGNEDPAETGGQLLLSGAAISLALMGVGVERRLWRWIGVLAAAGAFAMGVTGTYFIDSNDPSAYVGAMCLSGVIAYAVVALRVPLGEARFWTLFAAVGSTAALGGCVSAMAFLTLGFHTQPPDMLGRVTGALGIISACATLALLVIYRLNKRPAGTTENVREIVQVSMTCPHCGRKHAAPIGESACGGCGLVFTLAVREPSCAKCGYSLWNIAGGVCPECGTHASTGPTLTHQPRTGSASS